MTRPFRTALPVLLACVAWVSAPASAAFISATVQIEDPNGPTDQVVEQDRTLAHASLQIPPGTGVRGPTFAEAYGDEAGRVRAFARTGSEAYEASALVIWQDTIRKDAANAFFEFTITPGYLEILHGIPTDGEGLVRPPYAQMEIFVFDDLSTGSIFFEHTARIEGVGGDIDTETFELVHEFGGFVGSSVYTERVHPNPLFPDPVDQARYDTPSLTGLVDLSGLAIGDTLSVGYAIEVQVGGDGDETAASAFIGDPFDLNSGITTRYAGITLIPEPAAALLLLLAALAVSRRRSRLL